MHKIKIFYFIRFKPDSKDRVGEAGYQRYNTRWSDKQSYLTDRYSNSLAKLPKTDKIF